MWFFTCLVRDGLVADGPTRDAWPTAFGCWFNRSTQRIAQNVRPVIRQHRRSGFQPRSRQDAAPTAADVQAFSGRMASTDQYVPVDERG